ncbi:MAG: sulfatase [Pseudomonadota bacterium]
MKNFEGSSVWRLRAAAAFGAVLLAAGCSVVDTPPERIPAESETLPPPNIVILYADDLGYGDLGSYGHPNIRTPNLDRLAREGQRWTDFYAAAPVCSPSRGALLTGMLPVRTGLYGKRIGVFFPNSPTGMPTAERTLPEALAERGYRSAIIGKWHLGDKPQFLPTRHGFDYWHGIPYSNDMDWADGKNFDELIGMSLQGDTESLQRVIAARRPLYFAPQIDYWRVPLMRSTRGDDGFSDEELERPAQQTELTQRATDEAVRFMQAHRQAHPEQAFLLYVPYSMPHTPIFRSAAFAGKSLGGRYGDVIEELDFSVGEIVGALERLGLADNTLVVFTSDNGPWLTMNEYGGSAGLLRHGKGTTFEGGMRVPTIFWGPRFVQPGVVSDIGSQLDLYATALSLAGATPTPDIDGQDLSARLAGAAEGTRRQIFFYRQGDLRALRSGDFKLHLTIEGAYGQPPELSTPETPLLYNLRDDPAERFDVAARHPEVVARLLAEIEAHRATLEMKPPLFDARLAQFASP